MAIAFSPRPSQAKILAYSGGPLGIVAVPGAGKTHILSALTAQLISSNQLSDEQEVLIVTLVNSAVDNFEARIKRFFENPLPALYRYRVRTLHALAHEIVREKPGRVGLEDRFTIIDERESALILTEAVQAFLAAEPNYLDTYFDISIEDARRDWVRREQLPDLVESLCQAFIRSSKDRRLTPERIRQMLDGAPAELPLVKMGLAVYTDYQRALSYRGAVDFDDLIRLSLDLLENDQEFLERLRYRYPFILEDEAQDSSISQEKILSLLSGEDGNWVRVGDPNQAIYETFTTASPDLLRAFFRDHPHVDMNQSGRSQASIIHLANQLIDWVMNQHPISEARTALAPPHIQPVPAGDPQPNPPQDSMAIKLISKKFKPDEEIEAVVRSTTEYLGYVASLAENERPTIAILVPRNKRGSEMVDALRKSGIEPLELISSTSETRAAAGSLNYLLSYLSDPGSANKLSRAYQVWRRDWRPTLRKANGSTEGNPKDEAEDEILKRKLMAETSTIIRKSGHVEDFIAPSVTRDWLQTLAAEDQEPVLAELAEFRTHVQRWLAAVTLPIDQLILTLSQDVFSTPADLALTHKIALVLKQAAFDHPDWRLPELTSELTLIAKNERRFVGFSADDSGFDPSQHKGRVVVTTMHKAKGMEWDRVYLMSVNNYDFPSKQPNDQYISEKWFIRDHLNLEAEALAQLSTLESTSQFDWYQEGRATESARIDYVKERLRLLYVGLTRAKRDLIVTWNSGRRGDALPALALTYLSASWEADNS